MISCATNTALHTLQCLPSVNPVSVHVGTMAASITSVCGVLFIIFCDTITVLQTEQCLP